MRTIDHIHRSAWAWACSGIMIAAGCWYTGDTPPDPADAESSDKDLPHFDACMPSKVGAEDTSPAWSRPGQRLILTGRVVQSDGLTPAPGIVLYYYHTDTLGRYRHIPGEERSMPPDTLGRTHGSIRGWVRTGIDGRYTIRTARPGAYPGGSEPAHIHATILEPGREPYYIDDFVFDDDPLLTTRERRRRENRGGSGVVRLVHSGDALIGERDIILGLNIPGHASARPDTSGPEVGEDVPSFLPRHAFGPDKGTTACPMCKYGWFHGALLFVGEHSDTAALRAWLLFFESESIARGERFKACLIDGRPLAQGARDQGWEVLGRKLGLKHVALTTVPSFSDPSSEIDRLKLDPAVSGTLLLYRRGRVIGKAVNPRAENATFEWVRSRLDETRGEYFDAPGVARAP